MRSTDKRGSFVHTITNLWSGRPKTWTVALAIAISFISADYAAARDIYIVDTVEREATRQFGDALAAACSSCNEIQYRQMNGNMRAARRIAEELSEVEREGNLTLVVTLGRPATRIVVDKLKNTPVLYTFVGREISRYQGSERVIGLPTDASLTTQVSLLTKLLPTVRSAGIVVGGGNNAVSDDMASMLDVGVNVYRINDRKELPSALRTAVQMNDALILLRDQMVVNNDSIKFVLRQTLESGRHTIAYSRSLVDMGFAAALVPRPEAFGRLVGQSVEAFLSGGRLEAVETSESDYLVHTNPKVLERLERPRGAPAAAVVGVGQ